MGLNRPEVLDQSLDVDPGCDLRDLADRGGTPFCVSNERILLTQDALEGKGAISWGNPHNRLFVGKGASMTVAVDKLLEKVAARKRALPRRRP